MKAKELKAAEALAAYEKALVAMNKAKETMLRNYVQLRSDLERKHRDALATVGAVAIPSIRGCPSRSCN